MAKRGGRKMAEKLAKDLHHFGIHIPGDVALAMVRNRGWERITNENSKPGFHVIEERIMDIPTGGITAGMLPQAIQKRISQRILK